MLAEAGGTIRSIDQTIRIWDATTDTLLNARTTPDEASDIPASIIDLAAPVLGASFASLRG